MTHPTTDPANSPRIGRLQTHLAFCTSPESSRYSSIRIVEPVDTDAAATRGNLYLMVELRGDGAASGRLARRLLNEIQNHYYAATGGSQTGVLRSAILRAHYQLQQLNLAQGNGEVRAQITCATLINHTLIMAACGSVLNIIAGQQTIEFFPTEPGQFSNPLGGVSNPDVGILRRNLQPGDAIFLGEDGWAEAMDLRSLASVVASTDGENRYEAAAYLRETANDPEMLGLLIALEASASQPVIPDFSGEEQEIAPPPPTRTASKRHSARGLPTALGATPPVRDVPAIPVPRSTHTSPSRPASPTQTIPPTHPESARPRQSEPSRPGRADFPIADPGKAPPSTPRMPRWNAQWLRELASNILPDASQRGSTRTPPPRRSAYVEPSPQAAPVQATQTPSPWEDLPSPMAAAQSAMADFQPPPSTQGSRARLYLLLAILILVLAPLVVSAVYIQQGAANRQDAEELIAQAEARLVQGETASDGGDTVAARSFLNEAQFLLNNAAEILGNTHQISDLSAQVEIELQSVLQISPLYALDVPLITFPAAASPQEVIVADQDVFILEASDQSVLRYRLDPLREAIIEETGSVIRQNDLVEGVTVGRLVDIAWQPRITGFADKPSLLVLDRNNRIFRYNEVDGPTLLPIADRESWQLPTRLEVYVDRIYLADEQLGQILRYAPAGQGYEQPPTPWFGDQVLANLVGLRTFKIDGDIWLLYENGQILRYREGEQIPFALESSVGLAGDPVDLALGDQVDSGIYLADAAEERILVFDKTGAYRRQYRAAEGALLRDLRSIHVDESSRKIFILTDSALYQHPLPE